MAYELVTKVTLVIHSHTTYSIEFESHDHLKSVLGAIALRRAVHPELKIELIKFIRSEFGTGLGEAKAIAEEFFFPRQEPSFHDLMKECINNS